VGDVVVVATVVEVAGGLVDVGGILVAVGVASPPQAAPKSAIAAVATMRPPTILSLFISKFSLKLMSIHEQTKKIIARAKAKNVC